MNYCTFISVLIIAKHEIHSDNFCLGARHDDELQNEKQPMIMKV